MRAFVLSGGGNRGPLQVGALRVLLEAGIQPDLIVGSSAGALNGAYLAVDPTPAQCEEMARLWHQAGTQRLISAGPLQILSQILRGADHLSDNKRLKAYAEKSFGGRRPRFRDLKVPFFVTIAHVQTWSLYTYGDDLDADVVEAIATSAAVPGFFPPARVGENLFVDGGVISPLPVKVALARGATEIWALDIAFDVATITRFKGSMMLGEAATRPFMYRQSLDELEHGVEHGATVHHIPLYDHPLVRLGDFSKTGAMIEAGARAMRAYLAKPEPNCVHYPRQFHHHELPAGPPGSRPFEGHELHAASPADLRA